MLPPPSPRKYWTRRGIAEWLAEAIPTLVGIDHSFSFPLRYFEIHRLPPEWPPFPDAFQRHWPNDQDHTYVDLAPDGVCGKGEERSGCAKWHCPSSVIKKRLCSRSKPPYVDFDALGDRHLCLRQKRFRHFGGMKHLAAVVADLGRHLAKNNG